MSYSTEDLKIIFKDCSYLDKLLAEKSGNKPKTRGISNATNLSGNSKLLENMVVDLLNQDEKEVLKKYRGRGIKDHYFVSVLIIVSPIYIT